MSEALDITRPYLVIPKLVEQPTWGGSYIAETKGWDGQQALAGIKPGQSYELFSGSNLSLANSSSDPGFQGELTDRDAAERVTVPPGSISLAKLVESSPDAVLGAQIAERTGGVMNVLIKLTQAMGNSFQIHIKDGTVHPFWKPKPESWYYLEPGLITLGVRPSTDWPAYQDALTAIEDQIKRLESQVHSGAISYDAAQAEIGDLLKQYDPWSFVNTVVTEKNQLVDLSAGGLHHSWEENPQDFPRGNILYELQLEAMDHNSTIRGFDKGKMSRDGSVRALNVEEYFALIDRSPEANDPASHMLTAETIETTDTYTMERLLATRYYSLHKLTINSANATYREAISEYRHVYVQEGAADISTAGGAVTLSKGHSCFVPAAAAEYTIKSTDDRTELLITT